MPHHALPLTAPPKAASAKAILAGLLVLGVVIAALAYALLVDLPGEDILLWVSGLAVLSLLVLIALVVLVWRQSSHQRDLLSRLSDASISEGLRDVVQTNLAAHNEALLALTGQPVIGLGADGRISYLSPRAEGILGWSAEEARGRDHHVLIHHTRSDGSPRDESECPIRKARETGSFERVEDDLFWSSEGDRIPVRYVVTPISAGKEVVGTVVTFTVAGAEDDATATAKEFTAILGQQLAPELTAIDTALAAFGSGAGGGNSNDVARLDRLRSSSRRALAKLSAINEYYRFREKGVVLELASVELRPLVQWAVERAREAAGSQGMTIQAFAEDAWIDADGAQLGTALARLFSAVITDSLPGSTVYLEARRNRQRVDFSIWGTTPGPTRESKGDRRAASHLDLALAEVVIESMARTYARKRCPMEDVGSASPCRRGQPGAFERERRASSSAMTMISLGKPSRNG